MTSNNNKKTNKGEAYSSANELNNLDLENLSSEQIRELMEKITKDLSAVANTNEEITLSSDTESSPRPPWIYYT